MRRWASIACRSMHLAGVVLVGVGIVGNGPPVAFGGALMLVTGLALYALDLWRHPDLWREVAGAFVIVKLIVIAAMLYAPSAAAPLFWVLLVASSLVSHAPHRFRHARVLG